MKKVKQKKAVKKIEKPFADGTMSSSAFFGMIRAALRNKSRFFESVRICRERQKVAYTGSNKRRKWSYECEHCHKLFEAPMTTVHHRMECGSLNSFEDLPGFVSRLFCKSDDLILLCKDCHTKEHERLKKLKGLRT